MHQGPSPEAPRAQLRRRLRRLCLAILALLYGASIPWYRDPGAAPARLLGLPDWAAVAIACYALAAVVTALLWGVTEVPEAPPEAPGGGGPPEGRDPGAPGGSTS